MHLSSCIGVVVVLAAFIGALPIPSHYRFRQAVPPVLPFYGRNVLEILTHKSLEAASIHQFTRPDGTNACIDGALSWINLDLAINSSSSAPTATNDLDLPLLDACIDEIIDWAVERLVGSSNTTVSAAAPGGAFPGPSGTAQPPAVSPMTSAPSRQPSTDSDDLLSDPVLAGEHLGKGNVGPPARHCPPNAQITALPAIALFRPPPPKEGGRGSVQQKPAPPAPPREPALVDDSAGSFVDGSFELFCITPIHPLTPL
ncbi:hypothetical protein MVEN_00181700 [Mycena venus]|uniref:Uncharacterized protein n=1 Tax=Mycena venus TaxID=2733690 RepID=A0A8H6Z1C3_9AGAR|nr:hypothetical protein MVEN_00181700 [Mycena venus]